MQRVLLKNESGFTLVELILTITIIGMFSTVAIVNFQSNKNEDTLRVAGLRAVDAFRGAQSYALAGVPELADPSISSALQFGVYVHQISGGVGEAIIFADTYPVGGNGLFDSRVGGDTVIRTVSFDADNRKTVVLSDISVGGVSGTNPVSIVYKKPDATAFINGENGSSDPKDVILTFKHRQTNHTKTVTINRVTGRVDSQF